MKEQISTDTSVEELTNDYESSQNRVNSIIALASQASKWNMQHGIGPNTIGTEQQTPERRGLQLADFKDYVRLQAPEIDDKSLTVHAAFLQADISRYLNPNYYKDQPELTFENVEKLVGEGKISSMATYDPLDVIRYSVHNIRQTGLPFEGSDAERTIAAAIDTDFASLGRDPQSQDGAHLKQEILETA